MNSDLVVSVQARRIGAGTAILAAALVATASSADNASTLGGATRPAPGPQNTYVDPGRTVRPSVVEIRTPTSIGSGLVLDSPGGIVTNEGQRPPTSAGHQR